MDSLQVWDLIYLVVWPLFYSVLLALYWTKREDAYIKPRFPAFFLATNLYLLVCSITLPIHEYSVSSGSSGVPCWLIHSLSGFWPVFLFLHGIRALLLIFLYDLEFRRSSRLAFLLKRRYRQFSLFVSVLFGFCLSGLLIGVHSDAHSTLNDTPQPCFFLEDAYFFLALAFSLSIPLVSITIRMRRVKDFLSAGHESEQVHWIHFIFAFLYIISDLIPEWAGSRRSNIATRGTALHWIFLFHSIPYAVRSLAIPLWQLRYWRFNTLGVAFTPNGKPNANGGTASGKQARVSPQKAVDLNGKPIAALGSVAHNEANGKSRGLVKNTRNGQSGYDESMASYRVNSVNNYTAFQPPTVRPVMDLNSILDKPDLLVLFEQHAQKSFCSESVLFLKATTPLLRQASFLDLLRGSKRDDAPVASKQGLSNGTGAGLNSANRQYPNSSPSMPNSTLSVASPTHQTAVLATQGSTSLILPSSPSPVPMSSPSAAIRTSLLASLEVPSDFQPYLWFEDFVTIYDSFIRPDSHFEINISARLRREFKDAIAVHRERIGADKTKRGPGGNPSLFNVLNYKIKADKASAASGLRSPPPESALIRPLQPSANVATPLSPHSGSGGPAVEIRLPNTPDDESSEIAADRARTAASTPDIATDLRTKSPSHQLLNDGTDSASSARPDSRFSIIRPAVIEAATLESLYRLFSLMRSCHQEVSALLSANLLQHFLFSEEFIEWQIQQNPRLPGPISSGTGAGTGNASGANTAAPSQGHANGQGNNPISRGGSRMSFREADEGETGRAAAGSDHDETGLQTGTRMKFILSEAGAGESANHNSADLELQSFNPDIAAPSEGSQPAPLSKAQ